jgi:multiple sugar transport system permease protein
MRDLFVRKTLFKPSPAGQLSSYLILFIWTAVVLFPLYWLVVTSLKTPIQVHGGPFYIPFVDFEPTLEPWYYILLGDLSNDTLRTYYNTITVAPISALLALMIGSASAYALVRFSYRPRTVAILLFIG